MKISTMIGLGLCFKSIMVQAEPIRVFTWTEAWGKANVKWEDKDNGYRRWMKGGYEYVGCKGNDFSEVYLTRCMIAALFKTVENSLSEVGVKEKLDYEIIYQDLPVEEIHNLVNRWNPKYTDVLFVNQSMSSSGNYTRRIVDDRATVGVVAGKAQIFQVAHLLRHELSHAWGFDGHLYDPNSWTYKGCGQTIEVKPYSQSGLNKDCKNRTFVGSWIPDSQGCSANYMDKPDLYSVKWNVPVYGEIFKAVFKCHFEGKPLEWPQIDECKKILDRPEVRACLI